MSAAETTPPRPQRRYRGHTLVLVDTGRPSRGLAPHWSVLDHKGDPWVTGPMSNVLEHIDDIERERAS